MTFMFFDSIKTASTAEQSKTPQRMRCGFRFASICLNPTSPYKSVVVLCIII